MTKTWDEVAQEVDTLTDKTGQFIDEGIKPLIVGLRYFGIPTAFSCEGHTDGPQPYPSVDVIAEDLTDKMYEYIDEAESMTEVFSAHPEIAELRQKNFAAYEQMINILDDFYNDRKTSADERIVLIPWDELGVFRIECQGSRLQEFKSSKDRDQYQQRCQKEFMALADFLKQKADSKSIFDRVKALNFPLGRYVVVGGVMEAHGLRKANDIDIVVTRDFFDELSKRSEWELKEFTYPDSRKHWLKGDGVDIMPGFSYNDLYRPETERLIAEADIINDVPFIKLNELVQWKKAANRQKDQQDIFIITEYLGRKGDDNVSNRSTQ